MYRAPLPPPHIRGEGAYSFGRTRKLTAEQPEASTHLCCFLCLTCSQDFALSPVISPAWATTPLCYPMSFSLTGLLPTSSLCANPHTLEGLGSCCSVCPHLPGATTACLSPTFALPALQIIFHVPLSWFFKNCGALLHST